MTHRRRESGFTMIEVMIAILLTAIAIIGIIALYMTETRSSGFSRHTSEASVLAADKLEKLRTETAVSGSETAINSQGQAGGIFDRTWTVNPSTTYDDLQVDVSWYEQGVQRHVIVYGRRNL